MGTSTRARATGGGHLDRAGRRLMAAARPDAVAWALATELHRLVDADLVAVFACVADCDHPPGCDRGECRRRLRVVACLGNRSAGFASLEIDGRRGWLGGACERAPGEPRLAGEDAPEGLRLVATFPLHDADGPRALALLGRRADRPWRPRSLTVARDLCRAGEVAMAAAESRSRAEEVAVMRERRRLAREIHDTVGQLLFGAGVAARAARESAATGRADVLERLVAAEQAIGRASAGLRHAIRSLDSPRDSGVALPVSLTDATDAFRHRTGTGAGLVVLGERRPVGAEREHLLLRVVAEGLRNVERHSAAREVVVSLSYDPGVVSVSVQDDGGGPAPGAAEPTGLGLASLRDECRTLGGDLTLLGDPDDPDGGTTLRAWVAGA